MKPSQIIAKSAQKYGIPPGVAVHTMALALKQPNAKLMQHSKTLMYIEMLGPQVAKVFFISTDAPLALTQSINYFVTMLRTNKVQMIYMNLGPQDDILTALHNNGVDLTKSTNPQYQLEGRIQ
jgi:hypothetical protein